MEVQYCSSPDSEQEVFILCRSTARKEKEQAILKRFTQNIESGLEKLHIACQMGRIKNISVAERRIGRLLQRNSRAAKLFDIQINSDEQSKLSLKWSKRQDQSDWQRLSEGCYLLRSNITNWTAEELWYAYIHLTDAEAAFRIPKSDLVLRPIWHQIQARVQAHIFVCFLAYVL